MSPLFLWSALTYVIANASLCYVKTRKDYKNGIDFTLTDAIFCIIFGWWFTIPAMIWIYLSDKLESTTDKIIIIRSKN